ncbi:hypothetical protein GCM10025780_11380 [Frondihabitans cladoniiphilus]|uniref:Cell division protein FtsK n=1 Tax=Frondihabitans cladoniiphilus TaxID=715785 RepID=A0ABP8VRB1_9MICO
MTVLYRKPSRESLLTAAFAIGAVILVLFARAFVRLIGNAVAYDPTSYAGGFLDSPVGLFLGELVLYPFPFYAAAFVALTVFYPIIRQSPLSLVLRRSLAAGTVGTVVLALVGIATGIVQARTTGNSVYVILYALFIPLAAGVLMTAVLVGAAATAWLWSGRQGPLADEDARPVASPEPAVEPAPADSFGSALVSETLSTDPAWPAPPTVSAASGSGNELPVLARPGAAAAESPRSMGAAVGPVSAVSQAELPLSLFQPPDEESLPDLPSVVTPVPAAQPAASGPDDERSSQAPPPSDDPFAPPPERT